MTARSRAARALENVPGWAGARLTALEDGLTNTAWQVERHGRHATLKADPEPRSFPFAGRQEEAAVQRHASALGIAPGVIHASPTLLLTDYVDGRVWTANDLHDDANLVQLGHLLSRVHQLPLCGRAFDALRAGRLYRERIDDRDDVDHATADEHLDMLAALPAPAATHLCHNDVVAENVVATPDLRLLDWEYACDNDPMFDLAVVVEHHGLDDAGTACLLDAYGGARTDRLRPAFAREVLRYRALAWLWQAARP